jgi:hypothetical protein
MSHAARVAASLALLAALARAAPAAAQDEPSPGSRLVGQLDAGGTINPQGLALIGGVYYRDVWSHDRAQDFDSSYLQAGGSALLSPAYLQPSVHVELVPVPFLVLRAEYALQLFFGANNSLIRYDTPTAPFGDEALERRRDQAVTGLAERAMGELVLRAAFGRFFASIDNQLFYYAFHDEGPYLYDNAFDTLLARHDFLWNARAQFALDVSALATPNVTLVGPFYELTYAVDTDIRRQRVGAFAYLEPARGWLGFDASRIYGLLGLNLEDRNREYGLYLLIGAGVDFGR